MASRILIGTRKGLITAHRTAAGWRLDDQLTFLGQPVPMVLRDPRSGYIYAAINLGHFGQKLHRSKDNGTTWEEIAVPVYPPQPEGSVDVCPMRKTPIPWSLELIWSLETGAAEGQLWCGTLPGGLFVSRDHGDTWELNRPLWDMPERKEWFGGGYDFPGIHSICVDPRDKRRVMIAISCGGAWLTEDDGATWKIRAKGMVAGYMPPDAADEQNIQDAHRMVRCPGAPDNLWIQHHSGIFRTTNDGAEWTEIKDVQPSNFGFAVAVHPTRPDTAWFVPGIKDEFRVPVDGRLVVTHTQDGGKTFESLSKGLPAPPSWHLVYRHGLDIDETGETLVMGSTTGSLWITENGGDSWERISAELPPIYVVRVG